MAHIPLIHGPDGAKLSKRHGALGVEAYREMGYLPAALRNYLARLGWSHGDQEIFSTDEMSRGLRPEANVGRSPARFDFAKLENLNGHYMRSDGRVAALDGHSRRHPEKDYLRTPKLWRDGDAALKDKMLRAMAGLKERAKTLVELAEGANFLVAQRPLPLDDKAADILAKGGRAHLAALLPRFAALSEWSAATTDAAVRAYAEEAKVKLGQAAQPLRAALTGRATSPGIFDVLEVLGREESLARIADQTA
jgi:glutamyl-tRNA synthetase